MSSKYKVGEDEIPHFVTFSVVGWIDVFSREQYKQILVDSLQYCIVSKGLILHASYTGASLPKADLMPLRTAGLYPELENKS